MEIPRRATQPNRSPPRTTLQSLASASATARSGNTRATRPTRRLLAPPRHKARQLTPRRLTTPPPNRLENVNAAPLLRRQRTPPPNQINKLPQPAHKPDRRPGSAARTKTFPQAARGSIPAPDRAQSAPHARFRRQPPPPSRGSHSGPAGAPSLHLVSVVVNDRQVRARLELRSTSRFFARSTRTWRRSTAASARAEATPR